MERVAGLFCGSSLLTDGKVWAVVNGKANLTFSAIQPVLVSCSLRCLSSPVNSCFVGGGEAMKHELANHAMLTKRGNRSVSHRRGAAGRDLTAREVCDS